MPRPCPRLCSANVDRLTFDGTIIETGTQSYRLAHTRARTSPNGRPPTPVPNPTDTTHPA